MMKSDTIGELAAALASVQAKLQPAQMDATNPFLKNRYATLGAVIDTSRALLTEAGIAVTQMIGNQESITVQTDRGIETQPVVSVTTMIAHKSGEWISGTVSLPVPNEKGKSAAQSAGSVVTYLRRYGMSAALGIYADEDNDGNIPTQTHPRPHPRPQQQPQRQPEHATPINAEQLTSIKSLGDRLGLGKPEIEKLAHWYGEKVLKLRRPNLEDFTQLPAQKFIEYLQDRVSTENNTNTDEGTQE